MTNTIVMRTLLTKLLLCAALASATGCAPLDDDELPGEASDVPTEDEAPEVALHTAALTEGWHPWTGKDQPPILCDKSSMFSGAQCKGAWCDQVRAYCKPTPGVRGSSKWVGPFSEEGSNSRTCGSGEWITGLSCNGLFCDNVSIQCTKFSGVSSAACHWTGWMSDEDGALTFGGGERARGARCNGMYCDQMQWYVCKVQ